MVAALIGSGVALHVDRFYEVPPELLAPTRLAVFLAGLTIAISILGSVFGGVIAALLRFDYFNAVEVAVTVVRTAAIVYALERGNGLVALIQIQLATAVARTAIYALGMRRLYPDRASGSRAPGSSFPGSSRSEWCHSWSRPRAR